MAKASGGGRKRHPVITALWMLAATAIAIGFTMRIVAHFWFGLGLRLLGISFIAAGLAIGAIAWLAERITGAQPPP
ncbi:MAG TPA: hypothetical protein VET84_00325 [Stellaceae bacterium]|jgi:hypothetical protein|nr:hypothetical protein [Stellaceae bacterium]